jgi:hypothetical protein
MKLPKSLRIAGYDCKVSRADLIVDGEGDYGTFNYNSNEIQMAQEKDFESEEQEASTFLHEWLHGILSIYRIKVPDEEDMVERLETALFQMFKDNKTTIRSLLKTI